ncbi:unnamed protein product [Strongylus vulgaris]|uniref:NUC153 domain-containing protein n=1 Tax=Strongylus vulgaris TaxID=40348 RepID=A0A3P7I078_STRVU|nr:unnamed protein product [Strongylus vulgaris]
MLKSAVAQTSARIGWDETEELRQRKFEEAFNSDEEAGVDLIANSDSDDEGNEKSRQALLSLLGKKEVEDSLQVDWDDKCVNGESDEDDGIDEHDEDAKSVENVPVEKLPIVKTDYQNEGDEDSKKVTVKKKQKNTYQAYLERRKQKKAERKQKIKEMEGIERHALKAVEEQARAKQKENRALYKAAKQKEEKESVLAEAVACDVRFKALFTDSAFAIDQSSKNYKGSKLIEKQVSAKRQAQVQSQKTSSSSEADLISKLKSKSSKWKRSK